MEVPTPMNTCNSDPLSVAFKAARQDDEQSLATICDFWGSSQVGNALDGSKYTILHFIAFYGNSKAIERLLDKKLLNKEQLSEMRDVHGDTALHVAARFGRLGVVEKILNGGKDFDSLTLLANNSEDTPIYLAAASGQTKVFAFLSKKLTKEQVYEMKRNDGRTFLHVAIEGRFFVLAFSILVTYPELALRRTKIGETPLYLLACNKTAFRSGTMYNLINLSSSPFIPWRIVTLVFYYLCFTPLTVRNALTPGSAIRAGYQKFIKAIPFTKEAYEAREKHRYAGVLAHKLVEAQKIWPCHKPGKDSSSDPLIKAVGNCIVELVHLILKKFPQAATAVDENKRNILLVAAKTKDIFMYEYLKRKVADQVKLLSEVDCNQNSALHLAAERCELSKNTYSPLLGMAWDVFWYQHVKQDIPLLLIHYRNKKELTAKEIFKNSHIEEPKDAPRNPKDKDPEESHKDSTLLLITNALKNATKSKETMLIKAAEEDAKKVNEGLMLVSVLISTINFAAIFTIPGGFSQNVGIPFFYQDKEKHTPKRKELDYFLLYIGVSLLASLIALGSQLSIHLSRFRKIDFYFILPTKMFIAITALYYATTFSITACFQAYILENALSDIDFPTAAVGMMVACIPAALVYFDLVYYILNYLYFPIWYKFLAPPRQAINSFLSFTKERILKLKRRIFFHRQVIKENI